MPAQAAHDGAFSEYLLIGAEQCFPIPAHLDDGLAAMMEPFAVALHALRRPGSVAGKQVLVTGGGPIGLLTVIAARAYGATTIALSDPVPSGGRCIAVGDKSALDPTDAALADQDRADGRWL